MNNSGAGNRIASDLAKDRLGGWLVGVCVLLLGCACSALFLRNNPFGPQLVVLFFPGLGLWLLYRVAKASRSVRRYGIARLSLTEAPRIGAPLRGWIRFDKGIGTTFCALRLQCKDVDRSANSAALLLLDEHRRTIADGNGHIAFRFDLPADLPPSSDTCTWRLSVAPEEHGFDQSFDVPVGAYQGPGDTETVPGATSRPIDYGRRIRVRRVVGVVFFLALIPFAWAFYKFFTTQNHSAAVNPTAAAWQSAVDANRLAELKVIASKGFDIDTHTESGATALMLAGVNGRLETARWLVEQGADVNRRHTSAEPKDKGVTPLIMAGFGGNAEIVELLLDAGAQTRLPDALGRTSLHAAAWSGCVDCIRKLHARGEAIDVKATGNRGETPLMIAASRNQIAAMEVFIELGADPKAVDSHGKTPYDWAAFYKQADAMAWLRSH